MKLRVMLAALAVMTGSTVLGDVVYECGFDQDKMSGWKIPPQCYFEKDGEFQAVRVVVAADAKQKSNNITREFDLKPYRGRRLALSCQIKGDQVTQPKNSYNGIKFMLFFRSKGKQFWNNPSDLWGSFDWRRITFEVDIPADATDGKLTLGLQDSSGGAYFADFQIEVIDKN